MPYSSAIDQFRKAFIQFERENVQSGIKWQNARVTEFKDRFEKFRELTVNDAETDILEKISCKDLIEISPIEQNPLVKRFEKIRQEVSGKLSCSERFDSVPYKFDIPAGSSKVKYKWQQIK